MSEQIDRDEIRRVSATLTYRTYQQKSLDPARLMQLAEQWHTLSCSEMPGSRIKSLSYDGAELTVVFEQ
ncbi:hypothetical protein EV383_4441 [Pseudonocardia sediminis]|uniref:Uncharacterized protein n=1 Tax=Pseudonocardia sediminis TaxID=1397368 RepID=A0A4Q7UZT4_PSEST|nr:hypothetical protein [Pseudonocardia sediminis]RZT87516.1 hypothetical protein EV383_4441 [Pseudonocardia sediminis]